MSWRSLNGCSKFDVRSFYEREGESSRQTALFFEKGGGGGHKLFDNSFYLCLS